MVVGDAKGKNIYNGMAAGDCNDDGYDELILGGDQRTYYEKNGGGGVIDSVVYGPGEVYVIGGDTPGEPWPAMASSSIIAPGSTLVDHYFRGRDDNDAFGMGVVCGDLDGDDKDEVVVAAPYADGPSGGSLTNSGEIYIFYSNAFLPENVDLYGKPDSAFVDPPGPSSGSVSKYSQVIFGATASAKTGITLLDEIHDDGHHGNYEPVGLAIGDWNGDGFNDLAIGAGHALGGNGAVYIIYGDALSNPSRKLRPGNSLRLYRALGSVLGDQVDVKITGKTDSHLGAGIAFLDADNEGLSVAAGGSGKDDLILGAPYADEVNDALYQYYGEVYIVWGASSAPADSFDAGNTSYVDVTIKGHDLDSQIGGHFAGNHDIDNDFINDIGIGGQDESFVLLGRDRSDWETYVDLSSNLSSNHDLRAMSWSSSPAPSSMTIEFMNLDGNSYGDLVFGGYDNPGYPGDVSGVVHAGQMWVTKGADIWRQGTISANTTWSGVQFVQGDITVQSGKTLTLSPGSHIYMMRTDALRDGADSLKVEFNVEGTLVADGTAANPIVFESVWDPAADDTWGGFYFDNSSGGGTFDNCQIRNAEYAIESYVPLTVTNTVIASCAYAGIIARNTTTVRRCQISEASFGVYVAAGTTTIRDCTIGSSPGTCVHAQGSPTVNIRGSILQYAATGLYASGATVNVDSTTYFYFNGAGIDLYNNTGVTMSVKNSVIGENTGIAVLCDNGSSPLLDTNVIGFNGGGVYCSNSSSPRLQGNSIQACGGYAVTAVSSSNPDLGHTSPTGGQSNGNNNIAHTGGLYVVNSTGNTIYAKNNCWNKNTGTCLPSSSLFTGTVDYTSPICCEFERWTDESMVEPEFSLMTFSLPNGPSTSRKLPPTSLVATVPNPFNPTTTIHYNLSARGHVDIKIYDVSGRLIQELVNGTQVAGAQSVVWNGTDRRGSHVASGVYFVRMVASGKAFTRKMVMLK